MSNNNFNKTTIINTIKHTHGENQLKLKETIPTTIVQK